MRTRNAFTLIELLVVIAIVALLIGILLPALSKARQAAWQIVELQNMRQMTVAVMMYSGDEDDYYNPIQDTVTTTVSTPFGSQVRTVETTWRVHLWEYAGSTAEIYDSPAERQDRYADGYSAADRQRAGSRGPAQVDEHAFGRPATSELYNRSGYGANLVHYWGYPQGKPNEGKGPFGRPKESGYPEGLTKQSEVQSTVQCILFGPGTDHPDYPEDSWWIYKFDSPVRSPGFDRFLQHQFYDSEPGAFRFNGKGNYTRADGSGSLLDPRDIPCNADVCWWCVAIDGHSETSN